MTGRRRIEPRAGRTAVAAWLAGGRESEVLATAVRFTLEELAARAPGGTVEVRVPPFGAVQCVAGQHHSRGTPPHVIETDADTWLALATGGVKWADAVSGGRLNASGNKTDVSGLLPLLGTDAPPTT